MLASIISLAIQAQVPEKKKGEPSRSRGQERAINEVGVSVKSNPKKSASAKTAKPADSSEQKKKAEPMKSAKKPE
ncbi:MAG: hypothetical protein K0R26_64 [Bacteroidota bacterium]|nr:hypothetical protein [Bacteroidota bacterium]